MTKTAYVLGKRIARGGMAEIFLGKAVGEDEFQRICAIKRILPHYAQDKEFVEMFRDEAHICKRLQHNNIVQVYDFTEVDGSYALVMEHVDGADLRTLLSACETNRARLTVPMACYIVACAARGLHYAHTKIDEITGQALGIIHRDVSPQNILLSYEGEIKITDFGIASAEHKMNETRPGVVKGKYSYMSPEQVMAKAIDQRTDIFALAIVLWESLAMKRLFTGATEVETIRKVQSCDIPWKLTDLNPEVDADLMNIVHKGLQRDPKKRFATAQAFEKELLRYQATKFPDFTPGDLGTFLKNVLASRREKNQHEIKQTLTQTDLKKSNRENTKESLIGSRGETDLPEDKREPTIPSLKVELAYDPNKDFKKDITVSKSYGGNTGMHQPSLAIRSAPSAAPVGHGGARHSPPKLINLKVARRRRSGFTGPLMMFIALAAAAFWYVEKQTPSDNKMHFELHALPSPVLLNLNGKKLKNGQFIRTPITLDLPVGKYQLKVERPGFLTETINFQGSAGDILKPAPLQLQSDTSSIMINLNIVSSQQKLLVNFDNGLARGTTPLQIEDVKTDMVHSISFMPADGPDRRPLRCTFRPPDRKQDFVIEIQVAKDGKARCIGRGQ